VSKFLKKYGLLILSALVLAGIFYLNRYSGTARVKKGETLYKQHCSNCHGENGEGLRKLIPPLAGNPNIPAGLENMPCTIRYGKDGPIKVNNQEYNQPMAGISELEADEIKSVMDYILQTWYPGTEPLSQKKISEKLGECAVAE